MLRRMVLPMSLCISLFQLGCQNERESAEDQAGAAPLGDEAAGHWSEAIDLGDDLTVTMEVEPDGSGGLFASGPAGTHSRLESKLKGATTPADAYQRLKPGAEVPAALRNLKVEAKFVEPVASASPADSSSPNSLTKPASGAPAAKSAWTNYWCSDRIDENKFSGDFYHSYDVCLENRTTNLSYDYIGVREAFFVAQMVYGAGTYKVFDKANGSSTWISRVNVTLPQGYFYAQQRWGGSGLIDVRFQLLDVATDAFNWAMQSARVPMTAMPRTMGTGSGDGEYYHFRCQFFNWGPQGTGPAQDSAGYWYEGCFKSATLAGPAGNAQQLCDLMAAAARQAGFWNAASGPLLAIEKASSTNGTMCNSNTLTSTFCPDGQPTCSCQGMCPGYVPGN